MLKSINPYTNEQIKSYAIDSEKIVNKKLTKLNTSFQLWKHESFKNRSQVLLNIEKLLLDRKEPLALLITREMGKPISESLGEIEKCASVCRYYSEHGESFLKERIIKTEVIKNKVIYQPLGTIFTIMPWNFPFWQVFRFLAPNLMAGNVCALKHASNVQGCAEEIYEIVNKAYKNPLLENLVIPSNKVSSIIGNKYVKAVTLTGSEAAGISVAKEAANYMKKCVFELGGTDAFIVLKDADIHLAVKHAVLGRFLNAGQSCIAAKRFIIVKEIYDEFLRRFIEATKKLIVGNPEFKETELSSLAKTEHVEELKKQVDTCIEEGAKLELGGVSKKNVYFPTIISGLNKNSIVNREELFGPVACVFKVEDEHEAIEFANLPDYGLSSSLWSSNILHSEKLAERIDAGAVFINQFSKSDQRLPFGGIKKSGYGRELGKEGIKEFINIKTISIA